MRRLLLPALLLLSACGGDAPPPTAAGATPPAPSSAEARIGDVLVNASVVQTSSLPAEIAGRYGIERSDRIALLLVNAQRNDGGAPPADLAIDASATPPDGRVRTIELRPVQVGDSLDRIGTLEIAPPESVRFDVVVRYGTSTSTMQVTRDFYPR